MGKLLASLGYVYRHVCKHSTMHGQVTQTNDLDMFLDMHVDTPSGKLLVSPATISPAPSGTLRPR